MEGESVFRCSPWVNYTAPPSGGSEMMPNFAELPVSSAPASAVPEGGQSFTKFRIKLDSKSAGAPQPLSQPVATGQPSPVVPEFVGTWIEVQKPPERPRDDDVHSGGMLVPTNEPVGRSTPPAAAASMMNTFEIGAPGEWSQHTPKPPRKKPTKRVLAPAPTLSTFSIASPVLPVPPARADLRRIAPLNAHTHERAAAADGERRSAQRTRPHAGDAQDEDMPDDSDTRPDLSSNSAPRPSSPLPPLPALSVPPASPPEQLAPLPPLRPAFATVPAPTVPMLPTATTTQPSPAPERKQTRSPVFAPQSPRPVAAAVTPPSPPPKSAHAPSPVPDPPAPQPAPGPSRVVAVADTAPAVIAQPLPSPPDDTAQIGPVPSYLPPKAHAFAVAPIIRNVSIPTPPPTRDISAPVRRWNLAQREVRGIAGGRWFARSWAGASSSPYEAALTQSRIQPAATPSKLVVPGQPGRPPVVRMPTDLSLGLAASSAVDSGAVTDDDVSMAET